MDESVRFKYSSGSQLKSRKKKHDMVLSLGRTNMNSSKDETPTPTKFLKKCDEVGLFQDLKKVNPFEETFRKAAEAVTTSNVSSMLSLSRSATEDTLHTPHVFPNALDDDSRSKSSSVGDDEILSEGERVVRQEADTSILCTPATPLPTPIHTPFPMPSQHFLTPIQPSPGAFGLLVGGSNPPPNPNNEVQLCLKVSHGTTLELAGNTLKILGGSQTQPVQPKPPNIILDASEDMRTVIFATQHQNVDPKQDSSNVKEKLKNFLGSSKTKKTVTNPRKSIAKRLSEVSVPQSVPAKRTDPVLMNTQPLLCENSNSNSPISKETVPDDKIKLLREKNRAAAMRCRERKKAWVAELGRRADCMSTTNRVLVQEVKLLRAEVARLKALLLTHKDCPVTLAANTESQILSLDEQYPSDEPMPPTQKREERRWSHQLSLDIESATRRNSVLQSGVVSYSDDGCIDLSTPQDLTTQDLPSPLVRRDEILTSVAPTTPTDLPSNLKPTTPNIDNDIEMLGERSLATPVIQLNPNARGKDHGYR